jgi:hypothetical protein
MTGKTASNFRVQIIGVLLLVLGTCLGYFFTTLQVNLFLIPVRKLLVALGAAIAVVGALIATSRQYRPLTPKRAVWVPIAVAAALGGLLVYDLNQLGGTDAIRVALKPTQGALIGASFGVTVGTALRRGSRQIAVSMAVIGMVISLAVVVYYHLPVPSGLLKSLLLNILLLVILGVPAVAGGSILTDRVSGQSS